MLEGMSERLAHQEEKLKKLHEKGVLDDEKLSKALDGIHKAQAVTEIFSDQSRRSNVITVRLTDEAIRCLDDLISANIAQSRSEAAAILIAEGIKAQASIFDEIRKYTQEIEEIKQRLQKSIQNGFNNWDSQEE